MEKIPNRGVGVRKINVAAPDPVIFAFRAILDEAKRLGIVDDHKFGIEGKAMEIALLVFAENFEVARLRMIGRAMEGVVEGLGDREEVFATSDNIPAKRQA